MTIMLQWILLKVGKRHKEGKGEVGRYSQTALFWYIPRFKTV